MGTFQAGGLLKEIAYMPLYARILLTTDDRALVRAGATGAWAPAEI